MLYRSALLAILLLSSPAFAGVVFEFETVDRKNPGGEPDVIHTTIDGENLKIDVTGPRGANADMIYRGDRRQMIAIDHDNQSYVVFDDSMIEEVSQRLSGLEAQIQEALKDVPPDQRAMMEEMLRQRMPMAQGTTSIPTFEVRKTGDSAEQNGFPCEKHEIYRDGTLSTTIWVTAWDNVDGGREAAGAFDSMGDFIEEVQAAMPDFAKSDSVGGHAYEHLEELGGFPVVTIDHAADGTITDESRLLSSKQVDVAADSFDPPADYRQQQLMP